MKKRVCVLMSALLLIGATACGKDVESTEATTQERTEVTTVEMTEATTAEAEVTTEEVSTEVVATEEVTETVADGGDVAEEATEATQLSGSITVEEAEQLIVKALGTEDEETGNKYAFMHVNTMTVDGVEYHVFTWSWYVDGNVSHLTDLFVATDGSVVCEGMFAGDGATVYTETNYLE